MLEEITESFSQRLEREKYQTPYSQLRYALLHENYGKERRENIMKYVSASGFAVNRKYCPQLHQDPDLRKLIREEKLVRVEVRESRTHSTTYLKPQNQD